MATEDPTEQAGWLAALRAAYGPGGDEAGRAAILARLLAGLTPPTRAHLRDRWRAWAFDLADDEQVVTPADAHRFEALLPALLAATLDPAGTDYAWAQDYLEQGEAARAEIAELQVVLDEERAARQAAETAPLRPFPTYDLSFLVAEPPTPAREVGPAAWAAIQVVLEQTTEAGQRGLRLLFGPRPATAPAPQWQIAEAAAGYDPQPDGPQLAQAAGQPDTWTTLLAQTVDLGSAPSNPRQVHLFVQARPRTPHTCRLRVHLSGPGVAGREGGIRLLIAPPGSPSQERVTDTQGEVQLAVSLRALRNLTITVLLP